jgi:hypothetical protein
MSQMRPASRRSDGSIELDFYRSRAIALRGQAKRDSAALRAAGFGIFLTTVVACLLLSAGAASIRPIGGANLAHSNVAPPPTMEQVQ